MCFYYRESSNDVKLNIEGAVRERSKLAVGTYGVYTYEICTGIKYFKQMKIYYTKKSRMRGYKIEPCILQIQLRLYD